MPEEQDDPDQRVQADAHCAAAADALKTALTNLHIVNREYLTEYPKARREQIVEALILTAKAINAIL